jgi:hypothetical protein
MSISNIFRALRNGDFYTLHIMLVQESLAVVLGREFVCLGGGEEKVAQNFHFEDRERNGKTVTK